MNIKLGDYITAKIDGKTAEFKIVLYHEVMHTSLLIEVGCIANGKVDSVFDKSIHNVELQRLLDVQSRYLNLSKKGSINWTDEYTSTKKIYWFRDHQIVSSYTQVASIKREDDFSVCKSCREPVYMAGPNQDDGSFICYPCRDNPIRIYY